MLFQQLKIIFTIEKKILVGIGLLFPACNNSSSRNAANKRAIMFAFLPGAGLQRRLLCLYRLLSFENYKNNKLSTSNFLDSSGE
jgi:hypothetical protein